MPVKHGDLLPGGHVPQPDGFVPPRRCQQAAVGRKRHRFNRVRMPVKHGHGLPPRHVPQLHGIIRYPGRGQETAVGRKRHRIDRMPMSYQAGHLFPPRHVPQPDVTVLPLPRYLSVTVSRAHRQQVAPRRDRDIVEERRRHRQRGHVMRRGLRDCKRSREISPVPLRIDGCSRQLVCGGI